LLWWQNSFVMVAFSLYKHHSAAILLSVITSMTDSVSATTSY